jgi:hypothetical protein
MYVQQWEPRRSSCRKENFAAVKAPLHRLVQLRASSAKTPVTGPLPMLISSSCQTMRRNPDPRRMRRRLATSNGSSNVWLVLRRCDRFLILIAVHMPDHGQTISTFDRGKDRARQRQITQVLTGHTFATSARFACNINAVALSTLPTTHTLYLLASSCTTRNL